MDKFFVYGGCDTNKQYFTGIGKCDVKEGVTDYLVITRPNATFAKSDIVNGDFTTNLQTALALDYKSANKAWIVGKITTNNAPEGGDMVQNTKGTRGGSVTTGQNPITITYAFPAGVCAYNQLARLKGMECRVLRVDRNKNVFGVYDDKTETFKGFSATLWVSETPEADGGDVEMVSVIVSYGQDYFTKELEHRSNVFVTDVPEALRPVAVVKGSTTLTAKVNYTCSGEAIDDATATALADATAWVGVNESNAEVTITAVTYTNGQFTFVGEGLAKVKLASPNDLAELNVFGIEGFDEFASIV